jgi:hypothetical protein
VPQIEGRRRENRGWRCEEGVGWGVSRSEGGTEGLERLGVGGGKGPHYRASRRAAYLRGGGGCHALGGYRRAFRRAAYLLQVQD